MSKMYIERKMYLKRILPFMGKDLIKVIVGQRRAGKSFLLFQIMDALQKSGVKRSSILYLNKELHEFDHIRTSRDLLAYIEGRRKGIRGKMAVCIDEVQDVEHFERALRDLHAKGKYDIYCTGSNAELFSADIANALGGRYIEIPVYPLSYAEFILFHRLGDSVESLDRYFRFGGMPYLVNVTNEETAVYEYLRSLYNTILLKDVVGRFGVRNVPFLERLVEYTADTVGSYVSAKRISDFLTSQRISIAPKVVLEYLAHLSSAFFLYRTQRADIQGKKIFEVNEKYYWCDVGIRHALVGYRPADINKILENIVFMHLKISGYRVTVGQLGKKEIDFIAERGSERRYIQVAFHIDSSAVQEREFGNLLSIQDQYPKIVISMDEFAGGNVKGVEHLHVRDFLLSVK